MIRLSSRTKGFTLLEVLLSISILVVIAGLSAPVYLGFQTRNDLDVATTSVANALRRAQVLSESSEGDDTWGVKFNPGFITLFKGASYATRDTAEDEVTNISGSITFSYNGEVIFEQLTGDPSLDVALNITNAGDTRSLTMNEKGTVSY